MKFRTAARFAKTSSAMTTPMPNEIPVRIAPKSDQANSSFVFSVTEGGDVAVGTVAEGGDEAAIPALPAKLVPNSSGQLIGSCGNRAFRDRN